MLKGWWCFVQLCVLVSRWELYEEDVTRIGRLSLSFFEHFTKEYYRKDPSRLHIYNYLYHLLLHQEDSIRDWGPVSMVLQWAMEGYKPKLQSNTCSCRIYYRKC